MLKFIEQQQIDEFKLKGATVLSGVFADWVEILRAGIVVNMNDLNASARIYTGKSGGGRLFVDYCNWFRVAEYKDFIFKSNTAKIAAELMGSKTVQLFHEYVLVKEACTDVPTPWHQDAP